MMHVAWVLAAAAVAVVLYLLGVRDLVAFAVAGLMVGVVQQRWYDA